jgi:hypothetical protein
VEHNLRWHPAHEEWFCVVCGRTSDHVLKQDAVVELQELACSPPAIEVASELRPND